MSVSKWKDLLDVLSEIITIGFAVYGFICWVKGRFKAKPFGKTVSANFTYEDVKIGVEQLVKFSFQFDPEEIVGINRGGAIVGGLIGKHLGIVPRIIEVDPQTKRLWFSDIEELNGKRILLVDDRLADGDHMTAAYNYLLPQVKAIRKVTFAWIKIKQRQWIGNGPDGYAYEADSEHRLLPWEPKDGAKSINFARRSITTAIPFPENSTGNQSNAHRPPQKNKKEK